MAIPKLANIVLGTNPLVVKNNTTIDSNSTAYNNTRSYTVNNCYTQSSDSHYVLSESAQSEANCGTIQGNILGIVYQNKCLTTTTTEQKYKYTTGNKLEIQQSNWQGMVFNNYVVGGSYHTVWIFECIFQPYSNGDILSYGYAMSPVPANNCTRYRIYVNNNQLKVGFTWSNGSKAYTTTMTANQNNCGQPASSIAQQYEQKLTSNSLDPNSWYHLCLARLGDGQVSHGSGSYSYTLCYLAKIKDFPLNANIYQNQNSSIYYYQTLAGKNIPNGFGGIGSTTAAANVGRLSGANELNGVGAKVKNFYIGDTNIRLAANLFLYGGAYDQQIMKYSFDSNDLYFTSGASTYNNSQTYLGVVNYSSVTTQASKYAWRDSLKINNDGTITQN